MTDDVTDWSDDTLYLKVSPFQPGASPHFLVLQDFGGLCSDLGFLANLPELCDVTFLVGRDKEPVCAVKAILAARKASEKIISIQKKINL